MIILRNDIAHSYLVIHTNGHLKGILINMKKLFLLVIVASSFNAQALIHRESTLIYYQSPAKLVEVGLQAYGCNRRISVIEGTVTSHHKLIQGAACVQRTSGPGTSDPNGTLECIAELPPINDYPRNDYMGVPSILLENDVRDCM
jgi:hypothetical protein